MQVRSAPNHSFDRSDSEHYFILCNLVPILVGFGIIMAPTSGIDLK